MPTYKLDINNTSAIERDLNVSFDRMAKILPDIEDSVLKSGAMMLKEKVKSVFVSKLPSASRVISRPVNGYQGTPLVEGVRQSKVDSNSNSVKVHILGSRGHDMTWVTRFYESGTKDRYQTKIRGKKLKKRRLTGRIKDYRFLETTEQAEMPAVTQHMGQVYENKLNTILNG